MINLSLPATPTTGAASSKRLGKTYVSYGGMSILSNVLLWIEVAFFSVSKSIAPIVNLLVTIPLNFVINKLWTFRDEQ